MSYAENIKNIDKVYNIKKENIPSEKYVYIVPMFPYPSGNIHMGHVRNYTITNSIAQYYRVIGKNVIHPIGFDAFGLPAENAAIKNKMSPKVWTENNIIKMKQDFKNIGFDFNWSACIETNNPEYYKFEQEIFRIAWKNGIIYKKEKYVNYDPIDKTVLSNEQVKDGKGWRTGADIIRKKIPMYFFNMKKYAEELHTGLDIIKDSWPKQVIEMQKNWIGFEVGKYWSYKFNESIIKVFDNEKDNNAVIIGINNDIIKEFNNDTFREWINENEKGSVSKRESYKKEMYFDTEIAFVKDGKNYPVFIDINGDDEIIFSKVKSSSNFKIKINYINVESGNFIKLKDWCISRQRYWGNPIPMINCKKCGDIIDESFVKLPENLIPEIGNILEKDNDFINCICPNCNEVAVRCSDTMDTFVQSSWYYHYYITKIFNNSYGIINKETEVDYYVGGIEHATMHLIYTRFFHKMLRDFGFVSTNEPIKKLITQGMVCKKYINEDGKILSAKMSKSIGNIVEPKEYIYKYGSDALQMFMIFAAPPSKDFDFEDDGIVGSYRFLDSVYRYFILKEISKKSENQNLIISEIEKMKTKFSKEFEGRFNLNTLIPELMMIFKKIKITNFESDTIKNKVELDFINYLSIFAPKLSYYIIKEIS